MSVILHFMEHSSSKNSRYEHILHILFLLMLPVKAQAFSIHVRDYKPNNQYVFINKSHLIEKC